MCIRDRRPLGPCSSAELNHFPQVEPKRHELYGRVGITGLGSHLHSVKLPLQSVTNADALAKLNHQTTKSWERVQNLAELWPRGEDVIRQRWTIEAAAAGRVEREVYIHTVVRRPGTEHNE